MGGAIFSVFFRLFCIFPFLVLSQAASKQASKQARKQASKQASKQARAQEPSMKQLSKSDMQV